jgi:hypothetical protein
MDNRGFLRIRLIDLTIMAVACLCLWLFCQTFYFQRGFESSYKICPTIQGNEVLVKSLQYQDGQTVCGYADMPGVSVQRWKEAKK